MKRICCFLMISVILVLLCSCSQTSVSAGQTVTLTFITDFTENNKNIQVTLTDEEAEEVISILDGNVYDPTGGVPSCGFSNDISLKVGNRTYAIARDTCNYIQDCGNLKYFTVSDEEMTYIHELFEKYGGEFPCI